ncbi:uncharacterized protein B0H18DRAFT_978973 [Fomitopsis serialis]|uniref:uncharacterized protein n=1 Tax=Fomitopsis serialis TaxID=139415 RepID=UPI002007BAE7|nr:uncharacterized protein B0H18DRAFT_978973 [Neoantrodia serialis]KAH9934923.1 hypothetical protein B0H18DRAFT_978973 [Neoantrodia serialis]
MPCGHFNQGSLMVRRYICMRHVAAPLADWFAAMSAGEVGYAMAMLDVGFVENCCYSAACTIYTYDRCLTFWREFDLLWRHRSMSVATGLYLLLHFSIAVYLYLTVILGLFVTKCEVKYNLLWVRQTG